MSVFTAIDLKQLNNFLTSYPVGAANSFTGIEAGITNSNFFIDTKTDRYVLTIVENEGHEDVEWFMQLLAYLHQNKIPCAKPMQASTGSYTSTLADKPATVVQCLKGADKLQVTADDCYAIGQVQASFHTSCQNYPHTRNDSRGAVWRQQTANKVRDKLDPQDLKLLDQQMSSDCWNVLEQLPQSVIHADLFRDNVLFNEDNISGIIDFYYACTGCMLYDLAITFNDWCRDASSRIDRTRAKALLTGYGSIRPLQPEEQTSWPEAIRCAALRFWLSRLVDLHYPPDALMTYTKDPTPLRNILVEEPCKFVDLTS